VYLLCSVTSKVSTVFKIIKPFVNFVCLTLEHGQSFYRVHRLSILKLCKTKYIIPIGVSGLILWQVLCRGWTVFMVL